MSQYDEAEVDTFEDERAPIIQRAAPVSQVQSIDADYFAIVDAEDWPIAGLIVLLDRRRHAVRAELHLYEDGERQNEYALHQAQDILRDQYYSTTPVQLQVMQSYPWRETLAIEAMGTPASPENDVMAFVRQYWQYVLGGSALLILILFIWLIASLFGSPDEPETTASAPAAVATTADAAAAPPAADATATTTPIGAQTNGLPESSNANPNLAIGTRARVLPGFTVSLVREPANDQSLVIGSLAAGEEALIFDGPVYTEGDSDTIVWWHVRLDDGAQAWVPANTSEFMLLAPAE
jgi:hypothetical protein